MLSIRSKSRKNLFFLWPLTIALTSCAGQESPPQHTAYISSQQISLKPLLSGDQIALVRQTFPNFSPELFASETNPLDPASFVPGKFSPAQFYGSANNSGLAKTPLGVNVNLNGFDGPNQPMLLPDTGTYFDRQLNGYEINLERFDLVPLHNLENRMQVPLSSSAPVLSLDRRKARIELSEIDEIMLAVQRSVALRFPEATAVSLERCDITIEPAIFYVSSSNVGSTWAGGLTEELSGGRYRIRVVVFYINGQRRIADWREFLVHEAINFLVLAIGRPDLAL